MRWIRNTKRNSGVRPIQLAILTAMTIYITSIGTLSGTYLSTGDSITCSLETQWRHLFQNKDEQRVRAIQDAFRCCGFRTPRDMPWPFPSASHGIDPTTCSHQFRRSASCLGPWMAEERKAAGILVTVAWGVFVWGVVVVTVAMRRQNDASRFEELDYEEQPRRGREIEGGRALEY
ncbi:hypothetical protein P152DRAFT_226404 [Eremomyces bilateralis CBS 781.70]|uniref:Tetraspanin Tsp3 n=1 Tax=Eremomyces bilateralis CBS 781.70 TaxID=1392243 RepID=A0A6G1FRA3_9PEZI|nr:uncharacterized protein P152DRAFT_226404 [Eremomyces bilateralis CBS 781.70]KAF1808307.1 hypothetical protein P152DRAFT_226404 [Eremomyces bilateralis CBS 781.70]